MPDTILLTGITGFLGGHTAKALLDKGYHVRGSLRNPARADATARAIAALGADISRLDFTPLDLLSDDGWEAAAEGARVVVHTASPFVTTMPKDPDVLIRPAVAGTERAMAAARAAGVERVVLTSSTVTIAYGRGADRPARLGPDDWSDPSRGRLNAYSLSKYRAERRAWELARAGGPTLVTIQPGFILGPLVDDDPGTSGAVLLKLLRGDLPVLPRFHFETADVRDVAEVHAAACTAPEVAGQRLPAAFGGIDLPDMARALRDALGADAARVPHRTVPDWLVRVLALVDSDIRGRINELGYEPEIDSRRARALLGHEPRAAADSTVDMARDLIARGLV